MYWLYYQTHLSPQACHLAPATEGAIAAVSSSPLHIYPPNTSHWIQFILPEAFLSVLLSDSSIVCVCARVRVRARVLVCICELRAHTYSMFALFYLPLVCLWAGAFMHV